MSPAWSHPLLPMQSISKRFIPRLQLASLVDWLRVTKTRMLNSKEKRGECIWNGSFCAIMMNPQNHHDPSTVSAPQGASSTLNRRANRSRPPRTDGRLALPVLKAAILLPEPAQQGHRAFVHLTEPAPCQGVGSCKYQQKSPTCKKRGEDVSWMSVRKPKYLHTHTNSPPLQAAITDTHAAQ